MRELIVTTFLSLDGVMQAPGGPEEDDSGGFRYGGWSVSYWDDDVARFMSETMSPPFDLLLGRRTYDIFASFWPTAPEDAGGKVLNDATKYVVSRGDPQLEWGPAVLVHDVDGIAALKEGDGTELQVHGSANLLQTLTAHSVVDRYRLLIYPLLLGSGKRLFGEGAAPTALKLVYSTVSPSGVIMGTYQPAGEVVTGSFAPDPTEG